MKQIVTLALLILLAHLFVACGNNQSNKAAEKVETEMNKYENKFFSVSYPAGWTYDVEECDMTDSIPFMRKGIRVNLYDSAPFAPWHIVMIQKSAMYDGFPTPEGWRDLSVQLKQFDDDYIGIVESYMIDSLSFGNYPAAMAGLIAINEHGDTVMQKQLVVMVGKQVYYLNNTFPWRNDELEKKGDHILGSVRFSDLNE